MTTRLLATDIDGTLLDSNGRVSPRTRAALEAAEASGLVVAFVTGRPPRWLDDLIEQTGHLGVAVSANGAVLYDLSEETLITTHTIEPALVLDVAAALRSQFRDVAFAIEFGMDFAAEPGYVHAWPVNPGYDRRGAVIPPPRIGPLHEITDAPAVKLLAKDHDVDPDAFLAAAALLIGDRVTITHSSSIGLLELSAPGITKATGLADLAQRHGVAQHDVVAIGDMPNDIPMLQWAGRSIAVGNAHQSVKDAADEVTITNDEDAVAILIESLL